MIDKTYGRSVKVSNSTYNKAEQYRAITGVPIARIINVAVEDWLDNVGAAHIEAIQQRMSNDLKAVGDVKVVSIGDFVKAAEAVEATPSTMN